MKASKNDEEWSEDHFEEEEDDWMEKELIEREARLSRVEARHKAWEAANICRNMIEEVLARVERSEIENENEVSG